MVAIQINGRWSYYLSRHASADDSCHTRPDHKARSLPSTALSSSGHACRSHGNLPSAQFDVVHYSIGRRTGGIKSHWHNTTIQIRDCSRVSE